jgi:hypothetical protein
MATKKSLPPALAKNMKKSDDKTSDSKASNGDKKGMRKCPVCGKPY